MEVAARWNEFAALGVVVYAVSFEAQDLASRIAGQLELPFPILVDPSRSGYARFGMRRGSLRQILAHHLHEASVRGSAERGANTLLRARPLGVLLDDETVEAGERLEEPGLCDASDHALNVGVLDRIGNPDTG